MRGCDYSYTVLQRPHQSPGLTHVLYGHLTSTNLTPFDRTGCHQQRYPETTKCKYMPVHRHSGQVPVPGLGVISK